MYSAFRSEDTEALDVCMAGCAQRVQTPPRLLHCLGERGCIVGEKRGGAPCGVRVYLLKPDLCNANGSGNVIVDTQPDPDQHPKFITSRGSTLAYG